MINIDEEFVYDCLKYINSIKDYENIEPLPRQLIDIGEKLLEVVVFHDGSSSSAGASVFLVVKEQGSDKKNMKICKAGRKTQDTSIPVIEMISQSYSIVLLKPFINLLMRVGGKDIDFTFVSDSTCSLQCLKEDLSTTNKLAANSKIQKENLELLSTQFHGGTVRAIWVPSKLNISDTLTKAVNNPIQVVNSAWYQTGVMPNGERFVDLLDKLKENNIFLSLKGGQSVYLAKEIDKLGDCGYFDKTRRKMQEAKKQGRRVGGCFRSCGQAECLTQQNWFIENGEPEDGKIQIDNPFLLKMSLIGMDLWLEQSQGVE